MKKPIKKTTEPRKSKRPDFGKQQYDHYADIFKADGFKVGSELKVRFPHSEQRDSLSAMLDNAIENLENRLKSQLERIERIMK